MKKICTYLILVIVGIAVGSFTTRCFFKQDKVSQIDTLIVYKKIGYSGIDLKGRTYKINVPDIDVPELVLIPADSTSIIYKDSVRYVTLPRQYFYTKVNDAEIWHSGIDSTIDSLNVVAKTTNVTETVVKEPKRWQFSLDLGVDVGRAYNPYFAPNIGAEISLDRWSLNGAIGCNLDVVENNLLEPSLYYEIGLRYSLIKR